MANKQGTNQIVDSFIGDKLIEARYIGQTKYFDAYTEVTGTLPLSFDARAAGALKNYRLYGDSDGSGVQTENLWDPDNVRIDKRIGSGGEYYTDPNARYVASERMECSPRTDYSRNYPITLQETIAFYDADDVFILRIQTGRYTCTSPSNAKYMRASILEENRYNLMLVQSSTAPETVIPFGYKIPILNTSGVTENLWDYPIEQGAIKTSDGSDTPATNRVRSDVINLSEGTYNLSMNGAERLVIYRYDENLNYLGFENVTTGVKPLTFSISGNKKIRVVFAPSDDSTLVPSDVVNIMLTKGSAAPDHYIPHRYTSNYDLFIGGTKLGAEEYVDYGEQKVYKMVSGVLTPVDPPAPLPAIQAYKGENTISSTEEVGEMTVKGRARPYVYGFKIDQSVSDPATAVTYLADAVGKTPAAMGSTAFSYGDWANAFFMPRPCMLKSDGTVDYYLDPDDYSKKADGTASDVGDLTYDGNAMMEWPKIWYKFEEDEDGNVYFFCSYAKVDDSYHCWCNYDANNNIIPHFYTAIYNGIIRDNKMRSLSGFRLTPAIGTIPAYDDTKTYAVGALCKVSSTAYTCITAVTTAEPFDSSKWQEITPNNNGGTAGQTEVNAAVANNPANTNAWYTDVYADRQLVSALLILMGKSRNDQGVFGRGLDSDGQTTKEAYVTGTLDDKGLFWGVTANGNSAVKVFGMENWYGCVWRRTAGLIGITADNVTKYAYKLTYGTADGSTAASYGSTSTGYLITEGRPTSSNWVKEMSAGKHGMLPKEVGSSSSYYTVYFYTGTGYALFGGSSGSGLRVGSLYVVLSYGFSGASWYFAGALSCKPPKPSAS